MSKLVPKLYPKVELKRYPSGIHVHIMPEWCSSGAKCSWLPYPADLYCSFWSLYLSPVFHNKSTIIDKKEIQPDNYLWKVASIRSIFERDELSACRGRNSFGSMLLLRTCGIWKGGAGGCWVTIRAPSGANKLNLKSNHTRTRYSPNTSHRLANTRFEVMQDRDKKYKYECAVLASKYVYWEEIEVVLLFLEEVEVGGEHLVVCGCQRQRH